MLEIAAFGKISVGKSALLNAIFRTERFTVDPRGGSTTNPERHSLTFDEHALTIIDTPGIGEIAGESRAEQAREMACNVDLVLVLFDHDPTQMEFSEVAQLAQASKPMLVIINKADALTQEQRLQIYGQVVLRLTGEVDPSNVLICAADPVKHRMIEQSDGSLVEVSQRAEPDVEQVRQRLRAILESESQFLQEVDQVGKSTFSEEERLKRARDEAADDIDDFALGIAVGVAANPIPLVDLLGGGTALVVLVHKLAKCYRIEITTDEGRSLAKHLVKEGFPVLWPAVVPLIGGALLKSIPFIGWALGALGQATAAY